MKNFLYKIKLDLKQIFSYPESLLKDHPTVDYDYYWEKRGRRGVSKLSSWQKQRADQVIKLVSRGDVVLDIGCGDGAVLKYINDKTDTKGIGADMSDAVLGAARKLGIDTRKVDIRDLKSIDSLPEVDFIIGFEILEHLPEPETLVLSLHKKARKGLLFSFPNTGYYAHRLRLLFGRFPLQWVVHPSEHLRFWTVADAKHWLSSLGLSLDRVILYEGLPTLNKIIPSLFAQGIIVYIKKND
ncbi:MAG: class I SAM-dependent methyltransferase [Minisyncoccota bacterium]